MLLIGCNVFSLISNVNSLTLLTQDLQGASGSDIKVGVDMDSSLDLGPLQFVVD